VKLASPDATPAAPARRSRVPGVTTQIFIGLFIGIAIGYVWPGVGVSIKPLADAFLRMIKMIIARCCSRRWSSGSPGRAT